MEKLYIVLTATPTMVGRLIRFATKLNINHSSISFTPDLKTLYSFGRLRAQNPLIGGFVSESYNTLSFKGKELYIKVYEIPVSKEQLQRIENFVKNIEYNKKDYYYNLFELLLYPFKTKLSIKNAYTCSRFVAAALKEGNLDHLIDDKTELTHFPKALEKYCIYEGPMAKYSYTENSHFEEEFFTKTNILKEIYKTVIYLVKLIKQSRYK